MGYTYVNLVDSAEHSSERGCTHLQPLEKCVRELLLLHILPPLGIAKFQRLPNYGRCVVAFHDTVLHFPDECMSTFSYRYVVNCAFKFLVHF